MELSNPPTPPPTPPPPSYVLATETIPQSLIQFIALLITPFEDHQPLMYVSLIISLLSAGLSIAATDRVLDQSKARRRIDPKLYGYVPTAANGANRQNYAMVAFFSSYMGSNMFALAVLIVSASKWAVFVPCWFALEFCVLLGVRASLGNWRFYKKGADGAGPSLLLHLVMYIALLACPFPLIRNPVFLTPRVYSFGLLYQLLSNFVFVGIAYHSFEGCEILRETTAWAILFLSTVVCVVSGAVAFYYVPKNLRGTFYGHFTWKEYVATFYWNEARHAVVRNIEMDTQEGIRATLPLRFSIYYLPVAELREFYMENWERWEIDQPEWFDEEFKKRIPKELLCS